MSEPASINEPPPAWVVRGNPTEEELAAVVAVLSAQPSGAAVRQRVSDPATSGWSAYWRAVRTPLLPGSDGWRASGRPR